MKAVLMSIQPKWCELIASGKKTVEIRKTKPKLDVPFKVYIYCTNWKDNTYWKNHYKDKLGKVIGEFVCDKFTYIEAGYDTNGNKHLYNTAFIEHRMCIPDNELHEYLYKSRENSGGWAWHLSDLVIYDKPKELGEFYRHDNSYDNAFGWAFEDREKKVSLKRPPQSWCYVEGE